MTSGQLAVGVVGATGYTGSELVRLIAGHPHLKLAEAYSRQAAGQMLSRYFPSLQASDRTFTEFDPQNVSDSLDVLFLATPHAQSHHWMSQLVDKGIKIVDLSADFRLNDGAVFQRYYQEPHQSPDLMTRFVYGLVEWNRASLRTADYCAVPGCYATSVNLALYPAVDADLIVGDIVIDAKSGVSGAGKGLKEGSLFCEANETVSAYGTFGHRHMSEISMVLKDYDGELLFSPHLMPMNRGIMASIYARLNRGVTLATLKEAYDRCYTASPFVRILDDELLPETKTVIYTNHCHLSFRENGKGHVAIFSAIDNLQKGAAGQALQCLNVMLGWDETIGL